MPATPLAFAAIERYPTLAHQVAPSLDAQRRRFDQQLRQIVPRAELLAEFETLLGEVGTGLLLIEGPPGAGATTLLCQIANLRAVPLWLAADDAGDGLAALCAQIIALHDLPVPLVPPSAQRDAQALELLLAEAAARRPANDPLVVLLDAPPDTHLAANPAPIPAVLPPGVILVYATTVGASLPLDPVARLRLPTSGPVLIRSLVDVALAHGLSRATAAAVAAHSGRSFLYLTLACGLLRTGLLRRRGLPDGLDALYRVWWAALDVPSQRLATVLAAAGAPVPIALAATLAETDPQAVRDRLASWEPLVALRDEHAAFGHMVTRAFVAAQVGDALAAVHDRYVAHVRSVFGAQFNLPAAGDAYLIGQAARHVGLSTLATRAQAAPLLASRSWALGQERRTGDLQQSARDAAWSVRVAAEAHAFDELLRSAVAAGALASLGRRLAPDAVAEAFTATLDRGEPRDAALRRARALVDQLPDGRNKALVLRRMGEVCFERGMRAQAMRMLSEVLDLEVPGLPRSWRDEREEAQVALARVAIALEAPDRALGITVRIGHAERRGMIETEVVRALIVADNLTRAEEVAHAIVHEHTHEWAMAEVAVGHARAGNAGRFREVLGTLRTENAIAWARTELACDAARHSDTAAVEQVAVIVNDRLRDQALGLVVRALVIGQQAPSALVAARLIADREVRARTLIDFAQLGVGNVPLALAHAADDLRSLGDDARTPLTVLLATAHATIGDLVAALRVADQFDNSEERDRAYSRVAAALARTGDLTRAEQVAAAIPDDDERGWTQHELAHARASAGQWHEAAGLIALISDNAQRARAGADLRIARGRAGQIDAALAAIESLPAAERVRVLHVLAVPLVAAGRRDTIEVVRTLLDDAGARSRFGVALAAALAAHGQADWALAEARQIMRPGDRSRALIACARADRPRAADLLGEALRLVATLGRSETISAIIAAADLLVALGGPELLLTAAHALDEIDEWWA